MPDHSDSLWSLYGTSNRRFRLRLGRYAAAAEQIDAFVGERTGVALDAGCGRGRLARISRAPGLRWVGLDLSPSRLAIAGEADRYDLLRGDIRRLPVRADTLDVVTCIQVLEHFEEPMARELAADLGRLLRPGGLLLLSVPIFPAPVLRLKRVADRALVSMGRRPIRGEAHPSHFSLDTALRLIPPGFRVVDVRGVRLFSLPRKALESYRWWYRLHGWAGRTAPAWTVEVNISARSAA